MSSARQGLTIVGQIAGAVIGGPIGATIGGIIGGEVGGFIDGPPEGPRLDDTSAPALEFGSKVPRLYGRAWCTLSPRWWSGLRESSETVGGKGGDSGVEQFSYHADMLGVLCEVDLARWPSPVWTRIRIDGKIVASRLAVNDPTELWSDVELFTGSSAQAPWSVMEAAVGAANAISYRGVVSIGFTNLLMQNGRRPSLIEVEVSTNSTTEIIQGDGLLCHFDAIDGTTGKVVSAVGPDVDRQGAAALYSPGQFDQCGSNAVGGGFMASGITGNVLGKVWRVDFWVQYISSGNFIFLEFENGHSLLLQSGGLFSSFIYDIHSAATTGGGGIGTAAADQKPQYLEWAHCAIQYNPFNNHTLGIYCKGKYVGAITTGAETFGDTVLNRITMLGNSPSRIDEVFYRFIPSIVDPDAVPYPPGDYSIPAAFSASSGDIIRPLTVDLQDVLESEMLRCRPLTAGDIDMSAAAGKEVYGYKPAGSCASAVAPLLDWYFLDLFCLDKITVVARGGSVEQTIAYAYTGAAIGGASDPFAGLVRENDVEKPFSAAVQYINLLADGETDTRNGQRIGTGNETRQYAFPISSRPTLAQGRADTITHDARVVGHKATVRLGTREAGPMQPASVISLVDNKGNSYRTRVLRMVWNQGVTEADVCMDDPSILADLGIAVDADSQVITVAAPGVAEFLPLDLPKLTSADDEPGYLLLVKTSQSAGARGFDSPDNITYSARADYANDAVFGTVTAVSGAFAQGVLFDEGSSLTVNVGAGTLSSVTRAALLDSRALNAFAVGIEGRMVIGQFREAALVSAGFYTLRGFVNMGALGTEQYCADIAVGDSFAMLGVPGTARISRTLAQLGVGFYVKAAVFGGSLAGVTALPFTANGVSLKPLSPVAMRAERDHATGDITLSATRRTRSETRFGGNLGDACPLGEAIDQRRWRLYTSAAFTTVLREMGITGNDASAVYTAAQRATDGHTLTDPLYVECTQLSELIDGYPLQDIA
jgi:hypothetical protein